MLGGEALDAWVESGITDGVGTVQLSSWLYFYDFIHERFADERILDSPSYVFRGQRSSAWKLVSTLDRLIGESGSDEDRADHLRRFQQAARGRRGPNPPPLEDENDWWALGQHFGLATPLVDWTSSPFVAAYFAFIEDGHGRVDQTEHRVVFALHEPLAAAKSREAVGLRVGGRRSPGYQLTSGLQFVRPQSDENPRLINQGGLFTRCPDGDDMESWVRRNFAGENDGYILMKILIPDRDREVCLRDLNRMNINHLSLFPDLYGASQYCNLHRRIKNY